LLEAQDVASLCNNFSIAEANLVLLHIVTVREMFGKIQMTLNVKAPIIVDSSKRTAQQYVLPSNKYAVQVPLAA
jgi:flagellar assembly factor FliW